jgi:hypothetical protein
VYPPFGSSGGFHVNMVLDLSELSNCDVAGHGMVFRDIKIGLSDDRIPYDVEK